LHLSIPPTPALYRSLLVYLALHSLPSSSRPHPLISTGPPPSALPVGLSPPLQLDELNLGLLPSFSTSLPPSLPYRFTFSTNLLFPALSTFQPSNPCL
ncbi:hypothetical protein BDY24DRAFT_394689, partial [Mrakia frigida]|uniref:uncharacterized protein n=1 Tax=Mrakia frigida TaxID=29902 RepID=UPI003FCC1BB4